MIFFIFFCFLFPQQQFADGVLAFVGDRIILNSSVLEESFYRAQQNKVNPQDSPDEFRSIFNSVLKEKIQRTVILIAAEEDTSIVVDYDDIKKNLEDRVDFFIKQLGSVEALENEFGLSLPEIKTKYWEEVKEDLLIQSYQLEILCMTFRLIQLLSSQDQEL